MKPVFIDAIGLSTSGIDNWESGSRILRGEEPYEASELERYKPQFLPANERRRATNLIRLAFKVCEEITPANPEQNDRLATVFASSGGDYQILDQLSKVLALPDKPVSPTMFHNSVHNSAAGYFGIATGSREASTSISGLNCSFFSGLVEAIVQAGHSNKPILLAVYDTAPPEPMQAKRPITTPFACAFILSPNQSEKSIAKIEPRIDYDEPSESTMAEPTLEALRCDNPAARALPLLSLLAKKQSGTILVKGMGVQTLSLSVSTLL